MADERRDFGEFYPDGGIASGASVPVPAVAVDAVARARLEEIAAAAAALPELDPDGDESLADVKERQNGLREALTGAE